ncbi:MAG TPA: hypothetical protein VIL18_04860 [Longimicrobiales bacterium]
MTHSLATSIRRQWHPLLFAAGTAAIYAAARLVTAAASASDAGIVEIATTVDLTIVVPLLWYVLLVRGRGLPAITVLPVFLAGLLLAPLALPDGREAALQRIRHAAAPAELLLLAVLVRRTVKARGRLRAAGDADVLVRLRAAARELAGESRAADVIAYEAALLWYALLSWRARPQQPAAGEVAFSHHRQSAHGAVAAALVLAVLAEMVPVHLLVGVWSGAAAWALTALSAYGVLWILGDVRAARLRRTVLTPDRLRVRFGLRWTMDAPLEWIERVERKAAAARAGGSVHLEAALPAAPRVLIEFREPVETRGMLRADQAGARDRAGRGRAGRVRGSSAATGGRTAPRVKERALTEKNSGAAEAQGHAAAAAPARAGGRAGEGRGRG